MDDGTKMKFRLDTPEESPTKGLLESKAQRRSDMGNLGKDLKQLEFELDSIIKQYRSIDDLTKKETDKVNQLIAQRTKLKEIIKTSTETQTGYTKTLQEAEDITKELIKGQKTLQNFQLKNAATEEERNQIAYDTNNALEAMDEILASVGKKLENNKKASESMYDAVASSVKSLKNDVAQIATITGLDNIYNSLSGKNGQIASYNTMRSQFAMSKSDFNQFKRDIFTAINENGNIMKYGFQDALDYMNRLGELGITDQEMAKEQMEAIMLSTKYLGMSADTQTKILRQARNTGNMDLLNKTNQTLVQIMNAQLGVSKEQLDAIVNQSTSLADLSVMFSGNPNALRNFTMSASAIESVYGTGASQATMAIASDLLNNGGNSRYIGVLGSNYGEIMAGLQSGDGRALYQILRAVQTSSVSGSGASGAGAWSSLSGGGYLDANTMALYNARTSPGTSYDSAMAGIQSASDDTNKFLDDIQVDFKTMLENVTSWISAWLPLDSLQTIYYTLAIADMAFGVGRGIWHIQTIMKKELIPGLKSLIAGDKDALSVLGNSGVGGVGGKGLLGKIGVIASVLSIIAGTIMAINDGVDAMGKADDWGTSKGSALFGGILGGAEENEMVRVGKNTLKWALIGVGIGGLVGHPFIGGLLGAMLGSTMGMIGGESIAKFTDSLFGGSSEGAMGSASMAPITSGSMGGTGMGTMSSSKFPWTLTSPFGYRGAIVTKAGTTNPYHNGIDLAAAEGTPIAANNSGTVTAAGTANDGANYVIINSGDGYEQIYWHLMKPSHLKAGQRVLAGELVGLMGMTGMATGPHLHFGLRHAGTTNYIDPINSINPYLFSPMSPGVNNVGVWLPGMALEDETPSTSTILSRMIDADTLQKEAFAYDGIGSAEVSASVNNGFDGLMKKLDELSKRQDAQETMLKMLAQGKGTNVYKY